MTQNKSNTLLFPFYRVYTKCLENLPSFSQGKGERGNTSCDDVHQGAIILIPPQDSTTLYIHTYLCENTCYKAPIRFFMFCFVKAYPDSITDHVFMSKLASTYLSMNKLAVVFMVLLCANNAKNAYSFIHVLLRLVYIVCRLSRPSIFLFFSHIYIF